VIAALFVMSILYQDTYYTQIYTIVLLYLFDRLAKLGHLQIWHWRYDIKKTVYELI